MGDEAQWETSDGTLYRRLGRVRATRMGRPRQWTTPEGSQLSGAAGDWWVIELDGSNGRSVTDHSFRASHRHVEGDEWERSGQVRARRVRHPEVVATQEGPARADVDDWVLTDPHGDRWPVPRQHFVDSYVPVEDGCSSEIGPDRTT